MPVATTIFDEPDTTSPAAEVTALTITAGENVRVRYRSRSESLLAPVLGETLIGKATADGRLLWGVEGEPEPDTVEVDCPSPFRGIAEGARNIVTVASEARKTVRDLKYAALGALALLVLGGVGYGVYRWRRT